MKKLIFFTILAIACIITSCNAIGAKNDNTLIIKTDLGNIKIRLYDETPLHRDNFLKLVNQGFYDDMVFHRVIKGFMIQGGDPNANPSPKHQPLDYTIPSEFNAKFFHKRGVLAAARLGDQVNPEKRSSPCQFYIMQGTIYTNDELNTMETQIQEGRKAAMLQNRLKDLQAEFTKLNSEGKQNELIAKYNALVKEVADEAAKLPPFKFSEEQRKAYTTIGGAPSLDNNYTIFGEVTEGMDVVDKIAGQATDQRDRPLKDIKFSIEPRK